MTNVSQSRVTIHVQQCPSGEPERCLTSSLDCNALKIAIIGFGNLGQFLAETLICQGHAVLVHSRADHSAICKSLGVSFFHNPNDLCEEQPDVIILCNSIISANSVLQSLPLQVFKRHPLFVDVLPVKEFPRDLFLKNLPLDFDILCTHPMFDPNSAKTDWHDLPFVYDRVRIKNEHDRTLRCHKFLEIFADEGCRMVEMSCSEHDRYTAASQFITHTIGRILAKMRLKTTPISTKGYESLLNLVEITSTGSFELYYGLFLYNKNASEQLESLSNAFESLRKFLVQNLYEVVQNNVQKQQAGRISNSVEAFRDANQTIDHEETARMKIAIVGFGKFGQFLARTLVLQGHQVLAYSRSNYSNIAQNLGVEFFSDADDLFQEHPEVVLLCTSIISTEEVVTSLPVARLNRNTLFVDVLSVKEFPRNLLLRRLPPAFDILCTHPMFGPESGRDGWNDLPCVFDKVRIGTEKARVSRCDRFLDIFAKEGCRMVEMSCAEHDRLAAGSQFLTHTIGRVLEKMSLQSTPINTKGYETLLNLVHNTANDSLDLYYGLFLYNASSMEQLEKLDLAIGSQKKQLFAELQDTFTTQLCGEEDAVCDFEDMP